jgi:hypothetical protein
MYIKLSESLWFRRGTKYRKRHVLMVFKLLPANLGLFVTPFDFFVFECFDKFLELLSNSVTLNRIQGQVLDRHFGV